MNRILYDEELKGLVSERERLESLLNGESRELTLLKRTLENLLKTKKKEISNKLETIKYNSYMDKTINNDFNGIKVFNIIDWLLNNE